jgi:hypothetical protein
VISTITLLKEYFVNPEDLIGMLQSRFPSWRTA